MYSPDFCAELKEHCSEGHSILSFIWHLDNAHEVSISYSTMLEWAEVNPDFKLALEIAQAAELFYWEDKASSAMKKGDSQGLQMAKFMLDQKYSLYEAIYKKTLNTKTMDQLNRGKVQSSSGDPNEDILEVL